MHRQRVEHRIGAVPISASRPASAPSPISASRPCPASAMTRAPCTPGGNPRPPRVTMATSQPAPSNARAAARPICPDPPKTIARIAPPIPVDRPARRP